MKNLLFLLFFVAVAGIGQAQNAATETQEWTNTYNFTAEQNTAVSTIINRKYRNLAELETLKASEPSLYKRKYQGILQQTKVQVRRLMNGEQANAFDASEAARKDAIRQEVKTMQAAGANKEEISKLLEQLNY